MRVDFGCEADVALAPGHLIGQCIGNVLEAAIKPCLEELAERHELYLDSHGPRPHVRDGLKLSWVDGLENSHDLDFVLERGGSATKQGQPAAFIEAAWRRYTKHSRAKAQEIQGAVLPVLANWQHVKPSAAAVVAGEWSKPSLQQLRSSGFVVLHLHFPTTVAAFKKFGLDIEGAGETTDDSFWQAQVDTYRALSPEQFNALATTLRTDNLEDFDQFVQELEGRIIRAVDYVLVTPLHGNPSQFRDVAEAIKLVTEYNCEDATAAFVRFEIRIAYTNGDKIDASFIEAKDAAQFLETFV
ncbi:DNA methylase [Rhodococcus hoagii]|nr:DNA methylase [Prescottella equi]